MVAALSWHLFDRARLDELGDVLVKVSPARVRGRKGKRRRLWVPLPGEASAYNTSYHWWGEPPMLDVVGEGAVRAVSFCCCCCWASWGLRKVGFLP